jgi:hypothetical protein
MPGYGIPTLSGTFKAYDADLVDKQFRVVDLAALGIVDFCTAATDLALGVINNVPAAKAGADVEVIVLGEAKAKVGSGGVTAGQFVVPDANGDIVAATLGTTTTNVAIGRALESGDQYDIIRILVLPCFIQV